MKFVGIFVVVLFAKLLMRGHGPSYGDDDSLDLANFFKDQPHKKLDYDGFRSKLNKTEGILIPDSLLLPLPLNDVSSDLITEFQRFQQTLSGLSDCPSTNLSSVSTNLFTLLDERSNKIGSLTEDGSSLSEMIPEVFLSINSVIASLSIGTSISDAVGQIAEHLLNVVRVVDEAKDADSNVTRQLNAAVFPLIVSVQVIISGITVLAEAATLKIETSSETQEAIISLSLILHTVNVFVQSAALSIASIASSLSDKLTVTSSILHSLVWIFKKQLPFVTNVLSSITSGSLASSKSVIVGTISVSLKSFTYRISRSVEKLETAFLIPFTNQLEVILYKIIGAESDFISYAAASTATMASSIAAISSSDSGIQSKICRKLYPFIRNLMQLTGADNEIIANFASSMTGIFDIFKEATGYLNFLVGTELTKSITNSIEDVITPLTKFGKLLIEEEFDDMKMDNITIECAKNVQILGVSLIAITKSITNSTNDSGVESVIAFPILHSTVLYVVEWMTVVASSISLTKNGKLSESVSSLAATVIEILRHSSNIVEIIAVASTQSPRQIVDLILSPIVGLEKPIASLSSISKVDAKVSAQIEQHDDSKGEAVVVEGINNGYENNLSKLLSGLTGSLSSISSVFSSSLDSLNNSLKQLASSEFSLLRTSIVTFTSITTNLNDISASATQILNVTTKSLHSIFGRLVASVSKLDNFGNLVQTVAQLVGTISTALHSLIFAVNDYKGSPCYINDAAKDIAQSVQILISTLLAVVDSSAKASDEILEKLVVDVAALPYIVATTILVVQQVLGAAIPPVSAVAGSISAIQHKLTVSVSSILESLVSITTEVTVLLAGGGLKEIPSKILPLMSSLQDSTTKSLSTISGVVANIQVNLGLVPRAF